MTISLTLYWAIAASLALAIAAFFLLRASTEARRARDHATELLRENDGLRTAFAGLSGWSPDGTLPEDWVDRLRSTLTSDGTSGQATLSGALSAARDALTRVEPPKFLAGAGHEATVEDLHQRIVSTFDGLVEDPDALVASFKNGEMDQLFALSGRIAAYFPNEPCAAAYELATAVVVERLAAIGVRVNRPRLLGFVAPDSVEIETRGKRILAQVDAIRQVVDRHVAQHAAASEESYFVVDCIAPGWRDDAGQRRPVVQVWDRSWAY